MLASLYDVISCEAINVKNLREIWGTSFKFWLRPWVTYIIQKILYGKNIWKNKFCIPIFVAKEFITPCLSWMKFKNE